MPTQGFCEVDKRKSEMIKQSKIGKPGDIARWSSQANGISTVKRGNVFAVIPAGKRVQTVLGKLAELKKDFILKFDEATSPTKYTRYVVRVEGEKGHKPLLYYPRSIHIEERLYHPVITYGLCRNCETHCFLCPNNAYLVGPPGYTTIRPYKCTGCEKCVEKCPHGAIKILTVGAE